MSAPATAAVPAGVTATAHLPWTEWAAEALGLGLFMVSACAFSVWLEHPASPARAALASAALRRALIGLAMGVTAVALIHSPWGRRSGAHLNPATTLTFLRLGRVRARDAAGYVVAQFAGGLLGVLASAALFGPRLAHPDVRWAVTVPGASGAGVAFVTELGMAFTLMTVVLRTSADPHWQRFTGVLAGLVVSTFIALLAPLSGMSMNPARTFASALPAQVWTGVWIYFVAPPVGMGLAAEWHRRTAADPEAGCAKYDHAAGVRCLFCDWRAARAARTR